MSFRHDGDELRRKWGDMEDPESASAIGVRFFESLLQGRVNPLKDIDLVKAAVDPAWDGPRADVHVVLEALMKTEIAVYDAEKRLGLGSPQQIKLQSIVQALIAKGWHRKLNYKQATLVAFSAIKRLEDLVGRRQLLEILGRPTESAVGEATVEMLGIFPAALRRAAAAGAFKPKTVEMLDHRYRELLLAYLGPDLKPRVIYPGTDGLAAQGFYRFVHDPKAPEHLVKALYDLDVEVRPKCKRSAVTAHARDAEYASYLGDLDRARGEGRNFVLALEHLGMLRHLATVKAQGYFAY